MLSTIVLSYNRREALLHTLRELARTSPVHDGEIIVVDNASTDGSADAVRAEFPGVTIVRLPSNVGVEAFNIGVRRARGEVVLVLDDDAWPAEGAVEGAIGLLDKDERVAAVTFLPVHPGTGVKEWRFGASPARGFPFMGCGNIVRRDAWVSVGGYDPAFFLYRNDCDLALRLLGAGRDVAFDPAWIVWHDSPAAARKSERWLRLATRNWVWLARRHARGLWAPWGVLAGVAWAVRLAGPAPTRLWCVLRGVVEGVLKRPGVLPGSVRPDGRAFSKMVRALTSSRRGAGGEGQQQ